MSSTSPRPVIKGYGKAQSINSSTTRLNDKTTVFIRRNLQRPHIFFCSNCSAPLFTYQGQVASLIPGDLNNNDDEIRVIQFPITIFCTHSSDKWGPCKAVYLIEGWAL